MLNKRLIMRSTLILATLVSLCWCATLAAAAPVEVEATLSPQSFPINRAARFTITVVGSRSATIETPLVENIRFHERGKSSQINMTNGTIASSVSYNYLIEALEPGDYVLPAIKVGVDKDVHETKSIEFTVTAVGAQTGSGTAPGATESGDKAEPAFIRISETGSHYPGEIVPVTIKAYFNRNYRVDIKSLPVLQGDGVVMDQLKNKPRQSEESLNGARYNVLSWDSTLSGVKAGNHPITFSLDATLLIPQKRSRPPISSFGGGSMFDDSFFDSFLGGYSQRPITAVSPELTFEVIALPEESQPENFTGAIGDFSMQVSASPVEIEAGEPITLKVAISGRGNFDRVDIPLFPASTAWKTYDPTAEFSEQQNSYTGTKTFERAIVARSAVLTEIPSLSFSYYDPGTQKYVTRTSPPIPLKITQGETPLLPPLPAQNRTTAQQKTKDSSLSTAEAPAHGRYNFAPVKLESGNFTRELVPVFQKPWFITVLALITLILAAFIVLSIRSARLRKNPQITILRQRKQLLENDISTIEQARLATDSSRFLEGCRAAIQNQLGTRWEMEPGAISLADLSNRLPLDSPLIEIFKRAEEAVYGGFELSSEQMEQTVEQLRIELEGLR